LIKKLEEMTIKQ